MSDLLQRLVDYQQAAQGLDSIAPEASGRLTRMVGLTLEAQGCQVVVGDRCLIEGANQESIEEGKRSVLSEWESCRVLLQNFHVQH